MQLDYSIKLTEEAEVILKIETQITNLVFQHGHSLHAHAQGKTAILVWIDSTRLEHIGVNHTTAKYLKPPGTLADVASLTTADVA